MKRTKTPPNGRLFMNPLLAMTSILFIVVLLSSMIDITTATNTILSPSEPQIKQATTEFQTSAPLTLNIAISLSMGPLNWSIHESSDTSTTVALENIISLLTDEGKRKLASDVGTSLELMERILDGGSKVDDTADVAVSSPSSMESIYINDEDIYLTSFLIDPPSIKKQSLRNDDSSSPIVPQQQQQQQPRSLDGDCPPSHVTALIRIEVSSIVDGLQWALYSDNNDDSSLLIRGGDDYIFDVDQSWYMSTVCVDRYTSCLHFEIISLQENKNNSNGTINATKQQLSSPYYQNYEILIDGLLTSNASNVTAGYTTRFGNDCSICGRYHPLLAPVNAYNRSFSHRTDRIMTVLSVISNSDDFSSSVSSSGYRAACWIVHDDERQLDGEDVSLAQRYVLTVLYYEMGGEGWRDVGDDGFLTSEDECTWRGIECDDEGFVTAIKLVEKNLKGPIPMEITKLSRLTTLRLEGNSLTGEIPSELAELSHLSSLELNSNLFEGTIPTELGQLVYLKTLALGGNQLTGRLPSEFGALGMLEVLKLDRNRLSGIHDDIFNSSNTLEHFSCVANGIVGTIPSKLSNGRSLKRVYLSHNSFHGSIPVELINIPTLRSLYIDHNQLSGTIPSNITKSEILVEFLLHNNNISGTIPSNIGKQLTRLRKLDISTNNLSGTLPPSLENLSALQSLSLNRNRFIGTIPRFLGSIKMLSFLRLQDNDFKGTVPNEICANLNLLIGAMQLPIFITDCAMHFMPPKVSCSCCTSCSNPFLSLNRVGRCRGGEIAVRVPASGNDLEDVVWFLQDSFNQTVLQAGPYEMVDLGTDVRTCVPVTGCFTFKKFVVGRHRIFEPKKLKRFIHFKEASELTEGVNNDTMELIYEGDDDEDIQFGYVDDETTIKIGRCDDVIINDYAFAAGSDNRKILDGIIKISGVENILNTTTNGDAARPSQSYQFEALKWTLIDHNYPNGRPTSLPRYLLALLYHSTSGSDWKNSYNWLNPEYPECEWYGITCDRIGSVNVIMKINLANNNLQGHLMHEIGEFSALQSLDLSGNSIGRDIPIEIGNLWSLTELNLGNNDLSGTIPKEIDNLHNLKTLNMERNNLNGTIPNLENLTRLEGLDLSKNVFSCRIIEIGLHYESLVQVNLSRNLLLGPIPSTIGSASNLRELDLSNNELTGQLPDSNSISNLKSLIHLSLNGNKIEGSIPVGIGNLENLRHLMLQNNRLIGTIPVEVSYLTQLVNLSLSYNTLIGKVPSELMQLENLSLLHLHSNMLSGEINSPPSYGGCNRWSSRQNALIADCGNPSTFSMTCKCCTECCNSDGMCQSNISTRMPPIDVAFILTSILCLVLLLGGFVAIYLVGKNVTTMFFSYDVDAYQSCGDESVYSFLLTRSYIGWFITIGTVVIQLCLFAIFLNASSLIHKDSDWVYTKRCPKNDLHCQDEKSVSSLTWVLFIIFITLGLLPDFINGIKLVHKAVSTTSVRCLSAAVVLLFVTIIAFITSTFYNFAIAQKNTEVLINAAVLLFINDIDERMFCILVSAFPSFVSNMSKEATAYSEELVDVDDGGGYCHKRRSPTMDEKDGGQQQQQLEEHVVLMEEVNDEEGRVVVLATKQKMEDEEEDKVNGKGDTTNIFLEEVKILKDRFNALEKFCNVICDQVEILSIEKLGGISSGSEEKVEERSI